jgi:hypothetical protein
MPDSESVIDFDFRRAGLVGAELAHAGGEGAVEAASATAFLRRRSRPVSALIGRLFS